MVVPPRVARHKVRDIQAEERTATSQPDPKVVDLSAYSGRNVIPFPDGPTPAA
ncbi:hypothetical protein GCM10022248_70780 [Nonomuraea soli]